MLAALIPAGVACGNKVPTVCFPDNPSEDRLFLWLAIVNSLPFDWLLRRVVTTTINYFLLISVPLPRIDIASPAGQRLIRTARHLSKLDRTPAPGSGWRMANSRALIDVAVAIAYGLGWAELEVMLQDFPLLDRGQPPLPGEACSTVIRDYLLLLAAQQYGVPATLWEQRVAAARQLGAVAYVPPLKNYGQM